jgi:predicted double-glycine peptidase
MRRVAAVLLGTLTAAGATAVSAQERPAPYASVKAEAKQATTIPDAASVVRRPRSYIERRYENMVRQALDFSCGAAALATIINDYWAKPVGESDVIEILKKRYPGKIFISVVRSGFSFDDLIYAAEQLGFVGQGAKAPIGELEKLAGPVIVHLNKEGFEHFVVLRKARDNFAYVADPIAGNITMPYSEFYRQYTGQALAIWREDAELPKGKPLMSPRPISDASLIVGPEMMRRLPPAYPMLGR